MKTEITKMQLSDFEKIKNDLKNDFDDFWTPDMLKQELENKNRIRFILHSIKKRARDSRVCRSYKNYR